MVHDAEGNRLGNSTEAARSGIAQVVLSRIGMAIPSMGISSRFLSIVITVFNFNHGFRQVVLTSSAFYASALLIKFVFYCIRKLCLLLIILIFLSCSLLHLVFIRNNILFLLYLYLFLYVWFRKPG